MSGLPLPDDFTSDSTWLVQAIDPRARLARLVRMDDRAYRDAGFLDDRLLAQGRESRLCSLDALVAAAGDIAGPPTSWIFHIGHVGSTLLSRLLGELDGVLALREPRALRDLAEAAPLERPKLAQALSGLMGRRGPGERTVIVKATSFVSEYAQLLVETGAALLFLHASPLNYIASILAGENSIKELDALHATRLGRLKGRGIELKGFDRTAADRAALAWACEMTSLEAAAGALPDDHKILWADFDVMLGDMAGWLDRSANHFGISASADRISELAGGPLMRRYSKALEYDYSPALRAELLADAAGRNRGEIDAAVAGLRSAAESMPLLSQALDRAGTEH